MARQTNASDGLEAPELRMRSKSSGDRRSHRAVFRSAASNKSVSMPLVAALCVLAFASPAQAYLDPATGSTILQLLLGAVAGSMVMFNLYWTRVKAFFGISSDDPSDSEASPESSETPEPR